MVTLTSLPDELLLMVGAHVTHPADALHLIQTCRHMHRLVIPLLYESITLDFLVYQERSTQTYFDTSETPLDLAISSLALKLCDSFPLRTVISSLSLRMESGLFPMTDYSLTDLLTSLSALTELTLNINNVNFLHYDMRSKCPVPISRGPITVCGCRDCVESFWPHNLVEELAPVKNILKSLTVFADLEMNDYGRRGIGDLRHFTALEHFDIQSSILLGQKHTRVSNWGTSLDERLPLNLKVLHIRNYWRNELGTWFGSGHRERREVAQQGVQVRRLLKRYLALDSAPQVSLREIIVWLPSGVKQDLRLKRERFLIRDMVLLEELAISRGIHVELRLIDDPYLPKLTHRIITTKCLENESFEKSSFLYKSSSESDIGSSDSDYSTDNSSVQPMSITDSQEASE